MKMFTLWHFYPSQVHRGIKGVIKDKDTKAGIADAIIKVDDIDHHIRSGEGNQTDWIWTLTFFQETKVRRHAELITQTNNLLSMQNECPEDRSEIRKKTQHMRTTKIGKKARLHSGLKKNKLINGKWTSFTTLTNAVPEVCFIQKLFQETHANLCIFVENGIFSDVLSYLRNNTKLCSRKK